MVFYSREKIPIRCTKCGKINLARRDYLKALPHPYWCKYCKPHWRPKTFKDRLKLSLAHRKYNLDESFFSKVDNEEKAYWLGFLSGDGAITDKNRVKLRLSVRDKEHLVKHSNALEVNFRSFTKKFPSIPKRFERHFIRGVFDADGCINRSNRIKRGKSGQIYISYGGEFSIEGNREFVSSIQSRLVKLELPRNSINYSGKSINRVRYGGINQLRTIYKYLYTNAVLFLERKKKLFEDILRNYRCEVISQQEKPI